MKSLIKKIMFQGSALACFGCATNYRFSSTPEGAAVYYNTNTQRTLIGETPIDFAKTGLPTTAPFIVAFEKQGYESREIAITPTDNALTSVSVQLKPKNPGGEDEGLKRMRIGLQQIFSIQKMIFQKKYVDALAGLQSLAVKEPNLAEVFVLRGSIYASLKDSVQARKEWEKALALDSSLEEVRIALAQLPKVTDSGVP